MRFLCVFFLNSNARKRQLKRHQPSDSQESRDNLPDVSREEANCENYQELREMRRSEIYESLQ